MKQILDYIKNYPEDFVDTITVRSITTPSKTNRENHLKLIDSIVDNNWKMVENIISLPEYQKPLEGVIVLLGDYSSIDKDKYLEIYKVWRGTEL